MAGNLRAPRPPHMRGGLTRTEQRQLLKELLLYKQAAEAPAPATAAAQRPTPIYASAVLAGRSLRSRDSLDRLLPYAKAVLAALCWVNSFGASGVTCAQVELAVWHHQYGAALAPLPWRGFVIGLLVQVLLTAVQIWTAERAPRVYLLTLVPDAGMTTYQWWQWLLWPVAIALTTLVLPAQQAWWASVAMCLVLGWIIGVYSAKLPEVLVFGQRRKG